MSCAIYRRSAVLLSWIDFFSVCKFPKISLSIIWELYPFTFYRWKTDRIYSFGNSLWYIFNSGNFSFSCELSIFTNSDCKKKCEKIMPLVNCCRWGRSWKEEEVVVKVSRASICTNRAPVCCGMEKSFLLLEWQLHSNE